MDIAAIRALAREAVRAQRAGGVDARAYLDAAGRLLTAVGDNNARMICLIKLEGGSADGPELGLLKYVGVDDDLGAHIAAEMLCWAWARANAPGVDDPNLAFFTTLYNFSAFTAYFTLVLRVQAHGRGALNPAVDDICALVRAPARPPPTAAERMAMMRA